MGPDLAVPWRCKGGERRSSGTGFSSSLSLRAEGQPVSEQVPLWGAGPWQQQRRLPSRANQRAQLEMEKGRSRRLEACATYQPSRCFVWASLSDRCDAIAAVSGPFMGLPYAVLAPAFRPGPTNGVPALQPASAGFLGGATSPLKRAETVLWAPFPRP